MLHSDLRAAFARGFRKGWLDAGPVIIDMPPALNELRHVCATKAQKILIAETLRTLADRIENEA
jgi:hypothetical protein